VRQGNTQPDTVSMVAEAVPPQVTSPHTQSLPSAIGTTMGMS
jgi:hypothetical protein